MKGLHKNLKKFRVTNKKNRFMCREVKGNIIIKYDKKQLHQTKPLPQPDYTVVNNLQGHPGLN